MNKFLCMDCDHIWIDIDPIDCPKCSSKEIIDDNDDIDWEQGHFEGDLFSDSDKTLGYHQDDTGE